MKALDQEFFEKETEACAGLLYRVAYTILRNDADCQDAVQEALLAGADYDQCQP